MVKLEWPNHVKDVLKPFEDIKLIVVIRQMRVHGNTCKPNHYMAFSSNGSSKIPNLRMDLRTNHLAYAIWRMLMPAIIGISLAISGLLVVWWAYIVLEGYPEDLLVQNLVTIGFILILAIILTAYNTGKTEEKASVENQETCYEQNSE